MKNKEDNKIEKKIFYHSLVFPLFFLVVIWLVKISEWVLNVSFAEYGVRPGKIEGLIGVLFSPLIHGDWDHLLANSPSMLVLGFFLFYFYRGLGYPVFFLIYFLSGIWLWLGGRAVYHIGCSGIIYGLAAFLFFSGIFRKYPRLMAISLIIVFQYGGMIWGVFPIWRELSWEGHLFGALSGTILSFFYRKKGPQRPLYTWELEEDEEDEDIDTKIDEWSIQYHYKENDDKKEN